MPRVEGEEEEPKQESAKKPGKDDIHEQRQQPQPQEGKVTAPPRR